VTKVVGLTGGIASGKSTVARMLAELGAVVIDADAIVHELQRKGSPVLDEIVEAFGPEVLGASGELDREALAERVFRDPELRRRLNDIVHPRAGLEMARRAAAARESGAPVVVLDIPLLLEGRAAGPRGASQQPFDAVVVVYAPESVQLARQVERDGRDPEEARRRLRAQLPMEEKRRLADHVIDNSGSREETERQVRALWARLVGEDAAAG